MNHTSFPILRELGLNESEALIYELLLQTGSVEARELIEPSGLGRGNVYNVLTSLEKRGLVLALHGGSKTRYQAADPTKLTELLQNKEQQLDALRATFQQSLTHMNSAFTLSTGKPAIQLFEGLEGVTQALDDSLTATGEILTYLDPTHITGSIAEVNAKYFAKRLKKGVYKRLLINAKQHDAAVLGESNQYTESRTCSSPITGLYSVMELYDDKVAFHTYAPGKYISFILQNPLVTQLHRSMFEALWSASKPA